MEDITDILKEARENNLEVFAKDIYIGTPEEDGKVKIKGMLEVSTISKIQNELALFFYQEDIETDPKLKPEELEKKCKEELETLVKSFSNEGYNIRKGVVKT